MRETGVAYLLWAVSLFGFCGAHRIYTKKYVSGIIWLCTFGLFGIGQLVDLFLIPDMVAGANQDLLKRQGANAALPNPPSNPSNQSDSFTVLKAIRNQREATLAELVLATEKEPEIVKRVLLELQRDDLILVDNHPEDGRVVYRIN